MPALFGHDLPPCGVEIQVAYENVKNELRRVWLAHRGQLNILDVCRVVKDDLKYQAKVFTPFSPAGKRRKPWRRENVFKYELRWMDYFLREAYAQAPELLTESELLDRLKESSVPLELAFNITRHDILKLWDEWNAKKRAKTPTPPEELRGEVAPAATHGHSELSC